MLGYLPPEVMEGGTHHEKLDPHVVYWGAVLFQLEGNLPFESTSHVRPTDTSLKVGVRFPPPIPVGLRHDFQASQMPALEWLPLVQALEHPWIRAHSLSVLSRSAQMAS